MESNNSSSIDGIKGLTPEMRVIFTFHILEKKRIEMEKRRKEMEEPINMIRSIMSTSGATVTSVKKVNRGYEVLWNSAGYTINSLLSNDFSVISAGFCVSGYDTTQSASSVVKLLQDYVDQGDYIHRTRTA